MRRIVAPSSYTIQYSTMAIFRSGPKLNLSFFLLLSCLSHAIISSLLSGHGHFEFVRPAELLQPLTVELKADPGPLEKISATTPESSSKDETEDYDSSSPIPEGTAPGEQASLLGNKAIEPSPVTMSVKTIANPDVPELTTAEPTRSRLPLDHDKMQLPAPIRSNEEFIGFRKETLTYTVSLHGLPVGSAQMIATNSNGELRITTSARSNAALSLIYPVDNITETRMFNGRYIMTTIRQHEGSFHSDVGFTLCLGEKSVFWADRLKKIYVNSPIPTDQTMDIISGFFFLRNQELGVGKSLLLHLYDSNAYSPTEVRVLRRESLPLPGFRDVETLVIQPLLKSEGFFRRTGDILLWLTDDEFRVPVRMETDVHPLGRVSINLISSEVEM